MAKAASPTNGSGPKVSLFDWQGYSPEFGCLATFKEIALPIKPLSQVEASLGKFLGRDSTAIKRVPAIIGQPCYSLSTQQSLTETGAFANAHGAS